MPNSIVQGLTTAAGTDLNRMTSFQMVTLFGLLAYVSSKDPQKEVRLKIRDILEILEVSNSVNHAVERRWITRSGEERHGSYSAKRHSPKHLKQVHDTLLELHSKSVAIHHYDKESGRKVKDHFVHLLDSFGYLYEADGQKLDVDDLPPDRARVNIGTDDRPVWRVRRMTAEGDCYERPKAVTFRLNKELAREIMGLRGTIHFTLFAGRVFGMFRHFMKSPAAIRLLVLALRQTQDAFTRCLTPMLDDLGFDVSHTKRAIQQLEVVLGRLHDLKIVTSFAIDRDADRITITLNREWFREPVGE